MLLALPLYDNVSHQLENDDTMQLGENAYLSLWLYGEEGIITNIFLALQEKEKKEIKP